MYHFRESLHTGTIGGCTVIGAVKQLISPVIRVPDFFKRNGSLSTGFKGQNQQERERGQKNFPGHKQFLNQQFNVRESAILPFVCQPNSA